MPASDPRRRHAQVRELFLQACDLSAGRRARFLATSGASISVCMEVEDLLSTRDSRFLAVPVTGPSVDTLLADLAGQDLAGRYRLGDELGRGAYGVVVGATDLLHGVEVAVKFLHGTRPQAARRLHRREVACLRLLRVPGCAHLMDEGEVAGTPFLVTQRVRGRPFPGPRVDTWDDFRSRVVELLEVLRRIHQHGFVHLDLKPSNVLVDDDGRVTVLDFGVARGWAGVQSGPAGTPRFAAPEQMRRVGWTPDARADLFSLGRMVLETAHGLSCPMPASLAELVLDLTQDDRERRPGSAGAVLERLVGDSPTTLGPIGAAEGAWLSSSPGQGSPAIGEESVPRSPMGIEDLTRLVGGTERLFRHRSRTARELLRRTAGVPTSVVSEVAAWSRVGLASWVDGQLVLADGALEQLETGAVRPTPSPVAPHELRSALERQLLIWVQEAWPMATRELVTRAMGLDPKLLDERVDSLCRRGLLAEDLQRHLVALREVPLDDPRLRSHVHRRLGHVLRRSTEGQPVRRLAHLAQVLDGTALARESLGVGRSAREQGDGPGARSAFRMGLGALRGNHEGDPAEAGALEQALLREWTVLALQEFRAPALDRALFELAGSRVEQPTLVGLLRVALAVLESDTGSARELLEQLGPLDDIELESWRISLTVRAASAHEEGRIGAELNRARSWLRRSGSDDVSARLDLWEGLVAYRREEFSTAARHHLQSVRKLVRPEDRARALLNAGSAFMEAGNTERAARLGLRVRAAAEAIGSPTLEARAEWLVRACCYRAGGLPERDDDLLLAAARVGQRSLEGLLLVTEAAVAWRRGERSRATNLARRSRHLWEALGSRWVAQLMHALELVASPVSRLSEARALAEEAHGCPLPGLRLQVQALLRRIGVPVPPAYAEHLEPFLSHERFRGGSVQRLEVLALQELRSLEPDC